MRPTTLSGTPKYPRSVEMRPSLALGVLVRAFVDAFRSSQTKPQCNGPAYRQHEHPEQVRTTHPDKFDAIRVARTGPLGARLMGDSLRSQSSDDEECAS